MSQHDDDPTVTPLGVDSGGWPTMVAPGELVESAWGNAVVTGLLGVRVDGGYATAPTHVMAASGSILSVAPAAKSYATRMFVIAEFSGASDTVAVSGIKGQINTVVGTNQPISTARTSAGAGAYAGQTLLWSWTVPAAGNPGFAVSGTWQTPAGGNIYFAADAIWFRYRS